MARERSTSPAAVWLREFRLSGTAVVVLVLLVASLLILAPSLRTLVQQRQEIARLSDAVAQAEDRVDELDGEIARWSDPAYIEAQARDRLYYVYPGDQSFLLVGTEAFAERGGGLAITDEIQSTPIDWMSALVEATFLAGLTDSPPAPDGTIPTP